MKNVLFCGCSYPAGAGFPFGHNDPSLWVNLLHKHGKFSNCQLTNASKSARSNSGIFQDAVYNLGTIHYDYAVICWTSVPRYELELGVETYSTKQLFTPNGPITKDINLNQISYSKEYLSKIRDRFTSLVSDHYEILQIVHYVNALINLSARLGTKIFFVNSICPWDQYYFDKLENVLPDNYTYFTKKLINIENRSDQEIIAIYNKIHNEYNQIGGIQKHYWLNLYQSLRSMRVDVNQDSLHPGILSNKLYFEYLNDSIKL